MRNTPFLSLRPLSSVSLAAAVIGTTLLLAQVPATSRAPVHPVSIVLDRYVDGAFAVLLIGPTEEERIVPRDAIVPPVTPGTWLYQEGTSFKPDASTTQTVRSRISEKLELLRTRMRRTH